MSKDFAVSRVRKIVPPRFIFSLLCGILVFSAPATSCPNRHLAFLSCGFSPRSRVLSPVPGKGRFVTDDFSFNRRSKSVLLAEVVIHNHQYPEQTEPVSRADPLIANSSNLIDPGKVGLRSKDADYVEASCESNSEVEKMRFPSKEADGADTTTMRQSGFTQLRGRNPYPRRIYASRDPRMSERANETNTRKSQADETLASVLARRGTVAEGSAAIRRMLEAGVRLNVKTFNQLMTICANQIKDGRASLDDSFRVLELARSCSVEPDTILYNGVMSCCAKAAMRGTATVQDGSRILQEMKTAGLSPDIITYNSLLDICAKSAGRRASGDDVPVTPMTGYSVLKLIEDEGLSPTVVTFSSLMQVATHYHSHEAGLDGAFPSSP